MATAPRAALERRLEAARAAMTAASVDALVVTALANVLYLTNFKGSAAIAIVERERVRLLTDGRYAASVQTLQSSADACPGLDLVLVGGSYDATLAEVIAASDVARLGFEASHVTVSRFDWLTASLASAGWPGTLVPTQGLIERGRTVKDEHELAMLREGGRRLSAVAAEVFTIVRGGRRELDIAADIDLRLRRAGFERPAFDTIVASGPNSALPHARPGERKLGEGDLVVLDFGGVYASYCVDLTRTVVVGSASRRATDVHRAVLAAQRAAIATVAPGVSRFDIDGAARAVLAQAGIGEAFGHGTGHGLGIEIHEDPRIVQRKSGVDVRDEAVEIGMVFTIEPGAYFPGWGGVRIEDDLVVTAQGGELLTSVSTDLLVV